MASPIFRASIVTAFAFLGYKLYENSGFHLSFIKRCVKPASFRVSQDIDTYRLNEVMDGIKKKHRLIVAISIIAAIILFGITSVGCFLFLGGYFAGFLIHKTAFEFSKENCIALYQSFEPFINPGANDRVYTSILSMSSNCSIENLTLVLNKRKKMGIVAIITLYLLFVIRYS